MLSETVDNALAAGDPTTYFDWSRTAA